jgi:hypothetical protein
MKTKFFILGFAAIFLLTAFIQCTPRYEYHAGPDRIPVVFDKWTGKYKSIAGGGIWF